MTPKANLVSGLMFTAIGLFFAVNAYWGLSIGSATHMGPGYFPLLISIILIGFGLAICLTRAGTSAEAPPAPPYRAIGLVALSIAVFAALVEWAGVVPSLFLSLMLAAYSSRRTTLRMALSLAACGTAFSVLIFHYLLGLPLALFGQY